MFEDLEELEEEKQGALIQAELDRALGQVKSSLGKKRKDSGGGGKKEVSVVAKLRKKFKEREQDLKKQLTSERSDQEVAARAQAAECRALEEKRETLRRLHRDMKPFAQKYMKKGGPALGTPEVEAAFRDLSEMVNKLLEAQKRRDKDAAARAARIDRLEKRVEESVRHLLDQVNALSSGARRVTFELPASDAPAAAALVPEPAPSAQKGRRASASSRSFVKSPVDLHRDMLLGKRLELEPAYAPGPVPAHLLSACE